MPVLSIFIFIFIVGVGVCVGVGVGVIVGVCVGVVVVVLVILVGDDVATRPRDAHPAAHLAAPVGADHPDARPIGAELPILVEVLGHLSFLNRASSFALAAS